MKRQHVYGKPADDRFAMARGPRHRRPYPKEPKREMTAKWKADVLEALIGVDRKTVWQALTRPMSEQPTSSIVGALTDLAGVEPPLVEVRQKDDLDLVVEKVPDDERAMVAEVIRLMLRNRVR